MDVADERLGAIPVGNRESCGGGRSSGSLHLQRTKVPRSRGTRTPGVDPARIGPVGGGGGLGELTASGGGAAGRRRGPVLGRAGGGFLHGTLEPVAVPRGRARAFRRFGAAGLGEPEHGPCADSTGSAAVGRAVESPFSRTSTVTCGSCLCGAVGVALVPCGWADQERYNNPSGVVRLGGWCRNGGRSVQA